MIKILIMTVIQMLIPFFFHAASSAQPTDVLKSDVPVTKSRCTYSLHTPFDQPVYTPLINNGHLADIRVKTPSMCNKGKDIFELDSRCGHFLKLPPTLTFITSASLCDIQTLQQSITSIVTYKTLTYPHLGRIGALTKNAEYYMIVSIINNKGGVGKTTITCNLAHAAANKGKRVLVVDHDPQSNTSSIFVPQTGAPKTLHDLYAGNTPIQQCIYPTLYDGVHILPNEPATAALELELYQDVRMSYHLLRDSIRDYADRNYDLVLIDCPPTLGLWVVMSLVASDCAIIPIEAGSRYSIDGFVAAFDAINSISQRVNHGLKFLKAVVNKVDLRSGISRLSVEHIRNQFADKVFETTIPINADIQKAEMEGDTVIRHAPQSNGAKRFRALADEIIGLL